MNKVIDVLAKMAEDASLVNSEKLTTVITNADISTKQQQAFFAKDSQKLAKTITNFPASMCGVILTPQDTEVQETDEKSKSEDANNTLKFAASI
jgi:CO dehydrogenase/acetyl-CoA synthase alpha subunit